MRDYKWKEVVEWLEENPNETFDYGSLGDCMMGKFFNSKLKASVGEETSKSGGHVNYQGWTFTTSDYDTYIIIDPPTRTIGEIVRISGTIDYRKTGIEVLKYIKQKGY